jgi:hypothetical protein
MSWTKIIKSSPPLDSKVWFKDPEYSKGHAIGWFVGWTPYPNRPCFRNQSSCVVVMSNKTSWKPFQEPPK